jgi:hypothetical protein
MQTISEVFFVISSDANASDIICDISDDSFDNRHILSQNNNKLQLAGTLIHRRCGPFSSRHLPGVPLWEPSPPSALQDSEPQPGCVRPGDAALHRQHT